MQTIVTKKIALFLVLTWSFCFAAGYYGPRLLKHDDAIATTTSSISPSFKKIYIDQYSNSFVEQVPAQVAALYGSYNFNTCTIDFTGLNEISLVKDPDAFTTFINKSHKLPAEYVPGDLVVLNKSLYSLKQNITLREEPALQLIAMMKEIDSAGIEYKVVSGWRSYSNQLSAYNYWVKLVGTERAHLYAALPGHSEHQLGTTIDIMSAENNYKAAPNYSQTQLHKWLSENSYKYGFVMSYPPDQTVITGYEFEPWHYRYIGLTHAYKLKQLNINLTEYLYSLNYECI